MAIIPPISMATTTTIVSMATITTGTITTTIISMVVMADTAAMAVMAMVDTVVMAAMVAGAAGVVVGVDGDGAAGVGAWVASAWALPLVWVWVTHPLIIPLPTILLIPMKSAMIPPALSPVTTKPIRGRRRIRQITTR